MTGSRRIPGPGPGARANTMLGNLPLRFKILLILATSAIGLAVLIAVSLVSLRGEMVADRQDKARSLVEVAHSLAGHFDGLSRSGAMTREAAQAAAVAALRALRFGQNEYFWINDRQPVMVMHPFKPEMEGKDLSGHADPAGKRLFVEFVRAVEAQGDGYVDYLWPKPERLDVPVPKVSYVKGFPAWGWIIGSGIYVDDIDAAFAQAATRLGAISLVVVALGLGLALLVSRAIVQPITAMTGVMGRLAEGDTTADVPSTGRGDELGHMARAVAVFKRNQIELEQTSAQQRMEHRVRAQRTQALERLAGTFDGTVGTTVQGVTDAAASLEHTAGSMSAVADQTARQATAVAGASEQASANVQTVAAAAEELTCAITEISLQVTQSSEVAGRAVTAAHRANDLVLGLDTTTRRIGEIVGLITSIASQTNLLALNATIEAARAGEAGKGFAVVAGEVKNLANQTAHATGEITAQIAAVQQATTAAVDAIRDITAIIDQINEASATIAAAVQEQGATTGEIARSAGEAAAGTLEVSSNIAGVTGGAAQTGQAAHHVLGAAATLTRQADGLRTLVDTFLINVRAISATNLADLHDVAGKAVFMAWSDSLSVGDPDIDNDHMILVGLVNRIHEFMAGSQSATDVGTALSQLLAYTGTHFHHEESTMQALGYPDYRRHKDQHDAFTAEVIRLQRRWRAGEAAVGPELMRLAKEWLVEHIQRSDMDLGAYLQRRAAG